MRITFLVMFLFFIVGFANAYNFIDGKDGQLATLSINSFTMLLFFLIIQDIDFAEIKFLIYLIFLLLMFLFLNMHIFKNLHKIYLGNSGSVFLGFVSAILIIYYQKYHQIDFLVLLWFFTIPLFDFLHIVFKRIFNKKNPVKHTKDHIHDIFDLHKISSFKSLLILNSLTTIITISGIFVFYNINQLFSAFLFLFYFYLFCVIKNKLYYY